MPSTRDWYHMECDYFNVHYMEALNWEDMLVKDYYLLDSHPFIAAAYNKDDIIDLRFAKDFDLSCDPEFLFLSRLSLASSDVFSEGEADVLSVILLQGLVPPTGYLVQTQNFTLNIPGTSGSNVKSTPDRSIHYIKSRASGTAYMLCIVEDASVKYSSSSKDLKECQLAGEVIAALIFNRVLVGDMAPHTLFAFRFVGNFVTMYRIDVPVEYVQQIIDGERPTGKLIIMRYQDHSSMADKKGFDLLEPGVRKRAVNQIYSILQTFEHYIKPTIYRSEILLPTAARLYQLYDKELFGFKYEKLGDKLFSVEKSPQN